MSRDLSLLNPTFNTQVETMLARCLEKGYELRPFFTLRDVREQAKLWRQSRPRDEIQRAITKLRSESAPYIAQILEAVGPQFGRWATNSLPGQSWHQWGLAVDCFVVDENKRAIWSSKHPGYQCYADEARAQGLTAGYYWTRQDAVHVQGPSQGVRSKYTWAQIDQTMRDKFG